jgi:hypothetical protein
MIKYCQKLIDLKATVDSPIKEVGSFPIDDLTAMSDRLNIDVINMITVEDWDWEGLSVLNTLVHQDEHVLDVLILNLNEVEATVDYGFDNKIDRIVYALGFYGVIPCVGYESRRRAFIFREKEIARRPISELDIRFMEMVVNTPARNVCEYPKAKGETM